MEICPVEFQLPELYRCQHLFPDVDAEAIELGPDRPFRRDGVRRGSPCFLPSAAEADLFSGPPELLAVIDDSSEKILSGRWVTLAARSQVAPAPRYLYTAQAVSGDEDCVWLHTHGLNRCGCPELWEVLKLHKGNLPDSL